MIRKHTVTKKYSLLDFIKYNEGPDRGYTLVDKIIDGAVAECIERFHPPVRKIDYNIFSDYATLSYGITFTLQFEVEEKQDMVDTLRGENIWEPWIEYLDIVIDRRLDDYVGSLLWDK